MRCPKCQHENRAGAKFCEACGSRLELPCPSCGNQVRSEAAFCDNCGASLRAEATGNGQQATDNSSLASRVQKSSDSGLRTPDAGRATGERRQLTVMFCDLVDSTALSAQMDPEEWETVVQEYQHTCAEVIRRFDGHIAQYLGDGLLVYFGYPAAHEDDAQRAVKTGLEIVKALQIQVPSPLVGEALFSPSPLQGEGRGEGKEKAQLESPHPSPLPSGERGLQVRIGIHTGLVVISEIGDSSKRELLALGETPNLAARLQGAAEPDAVVVSAATYRLIEGLFDCQDLGPLTLKGVAALMQAYRIIGEGDARSRLDVAAMRGLTPLVGREEEIALLLRRWEQAKAGEGQVIMLNGEAGIGKSRLTQVLKDRIAQELHARVEWRCSPYHQNSALYPVIEQLQRMLQFGRDDSPEEKFHKLERTVGAIHESPLRSEKISLLASLLSLPAPDTYPPLTLTPQRQKQKTLEALLAWLLREAEQKPVLVVVEDLHWVDPSMLELLSLLIDQVPSTRVLVVLTFRPDFTPPWTMAAHLTHVTLSRFARRQAEAMVEKIAGDKTLPSEIMQQIVAKTDGVPLFVEELTKTMLESVGAHTNSVLRSPEAVAGRAPLQLTIPTTLQDSLMARLDRLGPAKEIAQLGAALGREFSYELLYAVSPTDEKTLQQALVKLVEAELLYERGQPPQAQYIFKHALIQDAAYQSLLKSTRQQMHQRIAQVLENRFPEAKENQPELLAHNYTEAGLVEQAVLYWQRAGQRATQRSANAEAIGHLTKALELLMTLPDAPERVRQELTLQLALGAPLIVTKGYTAEEVKKIYGRARDLCQHVGDPSQLFPALWGLALFYTNTGDNYASYELSQQCLQLARREKDPSLLLLASCMSGAVLHWLGRFSEAQSHLEQAIALYNARQHRSLAFQYGVEPGMASLAYAGLNLWLLGYPDRALEKIRKALILAQELSHPVSQCFALSFICVIHLFRREGSLAYQRAIELITLAREQVSQHYTVMGELFEGLALVEQGQPEEGLSHILQARRDHKTIGSAGGRSFGLARLVEAYRELGNSEEGLSHITRGLAAIDVDGDHQSEAELYRLKGELLLRKSERENLRTKGRTEDGESGRK